MSHHFFFPGIISGTPTLLLDNSPFDTNLYSAFGMRRLKTSYTGSLIRIRRVSDNVEADIGYDGTGGLDEAAVTAHCGAVQATLVTWYDQSGNGRHITNATTSAQHNVYSGSAFTRRNGHTVAVARATSFTYDGASTTIGSSLTAVSGWMYTRNNGGSNMTSSQTTSGFGLAGSGDAIFFGRNTALTRVQTSTASAQGSPSTTNLGTNLAILGILQTTATQTRTFKNGSASASTSIATNLTPSNINAANNYSTTIRNPGIASVITSAQSMEFVLWDKVLSASDSATLYADAVAFWT